jgi:hypothetical protein
MKGKSSSARVAIAAPSASMGGSAYSSAISRHKYASPPPRKPKRVKRNMADQFCTLTTCSERMEFHKDASGWGSRPAINSGESRTCAPDKYVPVFVRKQQGKNAPISDLGQARNRNMIVEQRKLLSNSVAASALQRIAASKQQRIDDERARLARIAFQAQARANAEEKCSKLACKQLDALFSR